MPGKPGDRNDTPLWGITAYFNPVDQPFRLENFRRFRAHLAVPLVAVELAYGPDFELQPGDADILIQLRATDVLWQKERLLNLALAAVPVACTRIAWFDCDVVFAASDWPDRALAALDRLAMVHLYRTAHHLPAGHDGGCFRVEDAEVRRGSIMSAVAAGIPIIEPLEEALSRPFGNYAGGLGWAARREAIEAHGFYDLCIMGSGDRAIISAAMGRPDHVVRFNCMNAAQAAHYLDWAGRLREAVADGVGFIDGDVFHLWHGSLASRRYHQRHAGFAAFGFDPRSDIALTPDGLWRWASDKPAMHDYVRRYFMARRDDAAASAPRAPDRQEALPPP
jgi:hypothetical protein